MPVLANGKTATGRAWVYVRGDQPFGGRDPPAALLHFSRDRAGEHAERHLEGFGGILQADAFSGFNRLYAPERRGGPLVEAACWAHARRKFFVLADVAAKARGKLPTVAPLALEAVRGIDAIFAVEREINGLGAAERLGARRERSAALVMELEAWMRAERARLSRHAEVAKVMDYMLKRWPPSRASSMTAACASRTTRPSGRCAGSPSPGHSAHVGRDVVVHYRWHPLFEQPVRALYSERRRAGELIHVETPAGPVITVPAWMLDPIACATMVVGAPQVSRVALDDLQRLLCALGFARSSATTRPSFGRGPMRTSRPHPCAHQLRLALDAPKLRGIGSAERSRVLTLLAKLLLEAAGAATKERRDERI